MDRLREIYEDYEYSRISAEEALKEIRQTYILTESELESKNLSITHFDYNTWQVKQNCEFIYEGDEASCYEKASEIIFK